MGCDPYPAVVRADGSAMTVGLSRREAATDATPGAMMHTPMLRRLARVVPVLTVVGSVFAAAPPAVAAPSCGASGSHTLCVTVPGGALAGATTVSITNSPNSGTVIARWTPSGGSTITLITEFAPSPSTNDYSFVWPTHKYLDASGVLRVHWGSTSNAAVAVPVTLANGNANDFQHQPSDWQSFLPNPSWSQATDPVVVAVGDGASNESTSNQVADSIAASNPPLFLYLGDIYEEGTFTENLNHYGENSMDGGSGTLWGQMGTVTQPALGDHEKNNLEAWRDYFHGRPKYTAFRFGNVLFLDLASAGESMSQGSPQYDYVESVLQSNTAPCVVAYFQNPVINKRGVKDNRVDMWSLLVNNGGDLVLVGNSHNMSQYKPLNDQVALPSPGEPTMVEMIAGSGGHKLGGTFPSDPKLEWSKGKTPGALHITLEGAANGGVPTGLSWAFQGVDGTVLHTGSRDCGSGSPGPTGPTITGFTPTSGPIGTSVTIDGLGFTGAQDVAFGGTSVGSGNYTVDSDSQITATVPSGATTGPVSVTTPDGTATSAQDFTVAEAGATITFSPDADTWVQSDRPDKNFGTRSLVKVDAAPERNTLLKFTVSGLGGASIANATLRLYCTNTSPDGGSIYPVADNSWGETSVTWNTAPAADPTAVASLGRVDSGTWVEIDVSTLVTGEGIYSLEIGSPSKNLSAYDSKEGTAGFAPQLVVALT